MAAPVAEGATGSPLFLDAPENNPAAIELVRRYRMLEVFGCARMYRGSPPEITDHRVFGVTTFELGCPFSFGCIAVRTWRKRSPPIPANTRLQPGARPIAPLPI